MIRYELSNEQYKLELNVLFEESKPYFNEVEGRDPLPPLIDINKIIPEIPKDRCHCMSIFYKDKLVGWMWIFDESDDCYYILHMYIGLEYRQKGIAKKVIELLEEDYRNRGFSRSELLVSGSNYQGLKFWTGVGYDKITFIEAPDEGAVTSSVELGLSKKLR